MQKILSIILNDSKYSKLIANRHDLVFASSTISTFFNFLLVVIKFIIGFTYHSVWLLGFGSYYLVMLISRIWLSYRYLKLRNQQTLDSLHFKQSEFFIGGILFSVVGLSFSTLGFYMYQNIFTQKFNNNVTYLIALIGFSKLIGAIVGLIKSRNYQNPIITLFKTFDLASGLVSITLTQYAILSMQKSPETNYATGLFGVAIGLFIFLIGIGFIIKSQTRS
ncbi:hypothetical protein R4B61_01700 [Fructilactobacillus vespulae]|uniref:hypothetical protein n=1 Tax=Fructilactobacillus vespulae TaxID=1249630 RepID=UPI0039B53CE4